MIAQGQMTTSGQNVDGSRGDPIRSVTVTQKPLTSPAACCTLDISGAEQERLVTMFKALGNPIRITGDIVDFLPLAQATVSQHLKVLREAGWITGETEGPATCYHLHEQNITWFREKVGEIF
jgi:ArsR family transcriptional regulator